MTASYRSWTQRLQVNGTPVWVPVAICGLMVALEGFGDAGREALRYDRGGVEHYELWRLVTAHGVHLGWSHLALNLAGLALLWLLFAQSFGRWSWAIVVAVSIASIDAGFYFLDPQLQWYVGASGVLHGVMAAGTFAHWRRRESDAWIITIFLFGKLLWEQWMGPLPSSAAITGGAVVVDAHLYGALGGLIAALWLPVLPRRTSPKRH